jgi:uncharacterized SAM-binding protein YcdF (DUF218 family)
MADSERNSQDDPNPRDQSTSLLLNIGRGLALFLAAFSLLNVIGELFHPGFDASGWWLDTRSVPSFISRSLILVFAGLMFEFTRRPESSRFLNRVQKMAVAGVLAVAVRDAWVFHSLISQEAITTQFPIPFSSIVAMLLLTIFGALHIRVRGRRTSARGKAMIFAATVGCTVAFPMLQIHCFGWTDYRRPANVAVVFGCKVYASGNLSAALSDRVCSACELYHQGLVGHLVMSGGPGQGDIHETDAMRDFAVSLGIPPSRILTDRSGLNTDETVANTVPLFREHGFERVLAVSHFFHLPRIKLAYQRAGVDVFTVPARQKFQLPDEGFMLVRETVALWVYYARPLTGI